MADAGNQPADRPDSEACVAGATDAAKFLAWQLVRYPPMVREHTHVHGATILTEVKGRRFVIVVAELPS